MIGSVIKKFAEMNGMQFDGGFAYGKVNGCHISVADAGNMKTLKVYVYSPAESTPENEAKLLRALEVLGDCDVKEYCLLKKNAVTAEAGRIAVNFRNAGKTMPCIKKYIDEILPRLSELQIDTDVCGYCGGHIDGDGQYVLLDDYVLPVHSGCVEEMSQQMNLIESMPKTGSVVTGAIGALIGALLGGVLYAAVFMLGYVASFVGLATGALSNWLYGKFRGKNNSARLVIVIVMVILGLVVGQVAGYAGMFVKEYHEYGGFDNYGMTVDQVLMTWVDRFTIDDQRKVLGNEYDRLMSHVEDAGSGLYMTQDEFIETYYTPEDDSLGSELRQEFLSNLGMGLLYGVIGSIGVFAALNKSTKRRTVKVLK